MVSTTACCWYELTVQILKYRTQYNVQNTKLVVYLLYRTLAIINHAVLNCKMLKENRHYNVSVDILIVFMKQSVYILQSSQKFHYVLKNVFFASSLFILLIPSSINTNYYFYCCYQFTLYTKYYFYCCNHLTLYTNCTISTVAIILPYIQTVLFLPLQSTYLVY